MDQVKIGKFIAACRKKNRLTQMQLAEKLNITDRAVSKWENGKAMPDSSIMLDLCRILKISVNDLLNGEVIIMEDYKEKSEQLLLEMKKQKEEADKRLLALEILIGIFSMIILLEFSFIASFVAFEISNCPFSDKSILILGNFSLATPASILTSIITTINITVSAVAFIPYLIFFVLRSSFICKLIHSLS